MKKSVKDLGFNHLFESYMLKYLLYTPKRKKNYEIWQKWRIPSKVSQTKNNKMLLGLCLEFVNYNVKFFFSVVWLYIILILK